MFKKKYFIYVLLFSIPLLIFNCGKKEQQETGEIPSHEAAQDSTVIKTIKPKAINYDSMLIVIADITKAVKDNPTDIEMRKKLVAVCYDTTWETILAAGFGESTKTSATASINRKYLEQAAEADSYRWAAYIKKWYIDPSKPDFGSIEAEIKGGRVVAKKYISEDTVLTLVEISSSKIF